MKESIITVIGIILLFSPAYSQSTYPNNEDGQYEDMLTPNYYLSDNDDPLRSEINMFVHFARLESFLHPLENPLGQKPQYTVPSYRIFGAALGPTGTSQHHPAIDLHIGNHETNVNLYAAYDGLIKTYRDAPKYRDYLSITKNIEDSTGNIIGKMVVLYAHIDLELDEGADLSLDGKIVQQGDIVSKHLYSGTLGGPHLHYEIRYYRTADDGDEDFYGFVGPDGSTTLTKPSAGNWQYGFWNPDIGYGYANPENHLSQSSSGLLANTFEFKVVIYPNPTRDIVTIDLNKTNQDINLSIYDLNGQLTEQRDLISTSLININLTNYNSGIYFLSLIEKKSNKRIIVKMVKE